MHLIAFSEKKKNISKSQKKSLSKSLVMKKWCNCIIDKIEFLKNHDLKAIVSIPIYIGLESGLKKM